MGVSQRTHRPEGLNTHSNLDICAGEGSREFDRTVEGLRDWDNLLCNSQEMAVCANVIAYV